MTASAALQLVSHPLCPFVHRATAMLLEKGVTFDVRYVDLRAKPAYMSLDNFRSWIEVESPNILQYHNPSHNSFSVLHQVSKKLELAR